MSTIASLIKQGDAESRAILKEGPKAVSEGVSNILSTKKKQVDIKQAEADVVQTEESTAVIKEQKRGFELKNMRDSFTAAQETFDPVVEQALQLFDGYIETGDPKMLSKAKDVLGNLANTPMWGLAGVSIPYGDFAGYTAEDLEKAMESDEGTVTLFEGIRTDKAAAKSLQDTRNREMLRIQSDLKQAESYGDRKGELKAEEEFGVRDGGIQPKTAAQLKDERELAGQAWVQRFTDFGFGSNDMKKFGLTSSQFGNMSAQDFAVENALISTLFDGIATGTASFSMADGDQTISFNTTEDAQSFIRQMEVQYRAQGFLSSDSPFTRILDWTKNELKKEKLSSTRKRFADTSAQHFGGQKKAKEIISAQPGD